MIIPGYTIYILLITGVVLSIKARKLTIVAAISGGAAGLLVFKGAGYTGLCMLALFFIAGSAATGWQMKKKRNSGLAENNDGRRTTGQVFANGGVAAIMGAISWYNPQYAPLFQLMMAGSLAAGTADTLSSELGSIYGRSFYDIITFKKVSPGPDGVVSMEGTLIGMVGAAMIALVYAAGFGFSGWLFAIVAAGALGNLFDSILGATLERQGFIGNNMVNFLNTLTGAAVCILLRLII